MRFRYNPRPSAWDWWWRSRTLNANGGLATGVTYQSVNYKLFDSNNFTGLHIHQGVAGVNGPVVINTGIPSSTLVDPNGGTVGPYYTEIDVTNAAQVATFANLFLNPQSTYINIHTNLHPRRRDARAVAAHRLDDVPDYAGFGQRTRHGQFEGHGALADYGAHAAQ